MERNLPRRKRRGIQRAARREPALGSLGVAVALVVWFAADGIAAYWEGIRTHRAPWEVGRQPGRVSLTVAIALVLAGSVAGVALCRGGA